MLKISDPDRFLLSLFTSCDNDKSAVLLVNELNCEIASLRDTIDTPHMGLIRLQWWRDEIHKICDGQPSASHPVLIGLSDVLSRYKIPFSLFDELLTAREADFEDYDAFDIYQYASDIHVPLLKIQAIIIGEMADVRPLATGYALIGLLRAIPFYRARSQVLLPDIQPQSVKIILDKALELLKTDTTQHRYFRAHRVLARLYAQQLKDAAYNPEKLKHLPFKELRVWWGSL